MIPAAQLRAWLDRRAAERREQDRARREQDRARREQDRAYLDAFIRDQRTKDVPRWAVEMGERLDRIEAHLATGVPRPGRCGAHPGQLPRFADCSRLAYACELDAGHAGMHRDGTMEWGNASWHGLTTSTETMRQFALDLEAGVPPHEAYRRAGYSREEC